MAYLHEGRNLPATMGFPYPRKPRRESTVIRQGNYPRMPRRKSSGIFVRVAYPRKPRRESSTKGREEGRTMRMSA